MHDDLSQKCPGSTSIYLALQQITSRCHVTGSSPCSAPLHTRNLYIRLLFINYDSVFNTIFPAKLIAKLQDLSLHCSHYNWIFDFHMSGPQSVRIDENLNKSSTLVLRKDAFSALFFTHCPPTTVQPCTNLIQFTNLQTTHTIVGRISNINEME